MDARALLENAARRVKYRRRMAGGSALPACLTGFGLADLGPTFGASPQTPVDATMQQQLNQLQQFNQSSQQPKLQGDVVVTAPVTRAGLPPPGGARVLIKSVTFEPASVFLTQAELDAITANYIGKRLDFTGISNLVRDVNDLYAKKGIVTASAILPPQKLTGGNLKIQLVEGRVGNVEIVGPHNTSDKYIFDRIHFDTDGAVDVPKAARDITFFNKTNQAQLRLQLQPGAAFGLTDLQLGIVEPPRNSLQVFVDNEGVESTGQYETGIYYHGYDLAGIDDNLTLYGTLAAGSIAGTVSYDAPFTKYGTRIAGSYTRSRIAVIEGPTKPLDITGDSQAASVTVSQPLMANTDWTVLASLSGVYGTSDSDSAGQALVNSITKKVAAGLSVSYSKDGRTFNVAPQIIRAYANDLIQGTSADLWLAAGTASASVTLSKEFTFYAQGAFQYSPTHLLPGDLLFQIGGANTVRGYSSDAVAGDSGYYAQLEVHRELDSIVPGLDAFVFTDVGSVYSTFPAVTTLASAGVGLSVNVKDRANAEIAVGIPLIHAMDSQPGFAPSTPASSSTPSRV